MTGADLTGADIQGATLYTRPPLDPNALRRAYNWAMAKLDRTTLIAMNLCTEPCHWDVSEKDFSGLDLTKYGRFMRPDFSNANLERTTLPSDLSGADLSHADLRNAKVPDTRMDGADLAGADLRGADLTGAKGLTVVQVQSAFIDDKTKLPKYLEVRKPFPPTVGSK